MKDKNNIFRELEQHLLEDDNPSLYFKQLLEQNWFQSEHPFTMLSALRDIPQSAEHHPEGNVWNHTMLVINKAAELKTYSHNPRVFMWSALLHDVGKVPATRMKKGRIVAYDHDKHGQTLARDFLSYFTQERDFIEQVSAMVRWHMQPLFVTKNWPFQNIPQMLSEVPLEEIALLSLCDRLGRGNMTPPLIAQEKENLKQFITICRKYIS